VTSTWENIPWKAVLNPLSLKKRLATEPFVNKIITPTETSRNAILLEGIAPEKVVTIHPGFDLEKFKPGAPDPALLASLNLQLEDNVILFIGRMHYQKGVFTLLPAIKLLKDDVDLHAFNLKFVLIGQGKEGKNIRTLVQQYGINDQVRIIKNVDYADLPRYYRLATLFVCPSVPERNWQEQFGMVFVESMASGVVPIGTYSGAIPEILADAGMLTHPGDHIDLARAIKTLIMNADLRASLRQRGLQKARDQFDLRTQAAKIAAVYRQLLDI
jgi:glycosyltransferase involved in cell wall biosynthesis